MDFVKYEHHGREVSVRSDLKGKHREYCLCHQCDMFTPGRFDADVVLQDRTGKDNVKASAEFGAMRGRFANCPKANEVFRLCVLFGMVLPVWECPNFKKVDDTAKDGEHA